MSFSYQQPIKNSVRERILTRAICALTTKREQSAIVQPDELQETVQYATEILQDVRLTSEIEDELTDWQQGFASHVSTKKPHDLHVLYLCGPEPLNDLQILIANGVVPQNVWAVESQRKNVGLAAQSLAKSYPQVRLHPGELSDLLRVYPGRFDIIYFDACGSLFRDKELDPIIQILKHGKLQSLSVLITNFALVPKQYQNEYASVLTSYFRFRYNDRPRAFWESGHLDPAICEHEEKWLQQYIVDTFEPFYSDFVSRFINDLARYWIPNCRALALRAVSDNYLINRDQLAEYLDKAQRVPDYDAESIEKWLDEVGHLALSPSSYPLLSFYRTLKVKGHAFAAELERLEIDGHKLSALLGPASILERVVEGHWEALSREMITAIAFSWFDSQCPFSCDAPLPNLLINSLLGIYGHPYFPNPRRGERISYTAKKTKMFTDVFVYDQCRYYYDWFPTILLAPFRFRSRAFQVVARCILDRLGRADHSSSTHPFRGAAVVGMGETASAKIYNVMPREALLQQDKEAQK